MGRYKALLIGNGKFEQDPHNLLELKGPQNDLLLLKQALTHPQVGIHEAGDVVTLLDATSQEVRNTVVEFFQSAAPDDQLLFFFSGHGRLDNYNRLYLCTRDTRVDRLLASAIPDSVVSEAIRDSYAKRFAIILDCCHSGQFKGGQLPMTLAEGSGRFLLTSCQSAALSQDSQQPGGASAFTQMLVEALLSGEVDQNGDGFVELNEVYNFILPRLQAKTGQIPQRHLDKTTGDIPLGKSVPRAEAVVVPAIPPAAPAPGERPILNVSTSSLELKNVSLGETLPDEIIDVFNEGGGELSWRVETDVPWIQLELGRGFFKVRLRPTQAGANRGNIYVRDQGRGGSRKISVTAFVLAETPKPVLEVTPAALDFKTVKVGSLPARGSLRLVNRGGGQLNARVECSGEGLRAEQRGDVIEISADASQARTIEGRIEITSDGGAASIPVRGVVEPGPVLEASPRQLDFGQMKSNESRTLELRIRNGGSGTLEWSEHTDDSFFHLRRQGKGLSVSIKDLSVGHYLGSIRIKSNGGEATVNVVAEVQAPPAPKPPPIPAPAPLPPAPMLPSLAGWWRGATGSIFVTGQGSFYQYVDYNLFGIQVGTGTLTLAGNVVNLEGTNALFMGVQGQLMLQGNQLSGTVWSMAGAAPVLFFRS